jgi:hypothetical protein
MLKAGPGHTGNSEWKRLGFLPSVNIHRMRGPLAQGYHIGSSSLRIRVQILLNNETFLEQACDQ